MDRIRIAMALFDSGSRAFPVRLWDGTVLPPRREGGPRGAVVLRAPEVLDTFFPPAAEHRLAEAFIDGKLELEGDAIGLVEAAARWEGPRASLALVLPAGEAWARRLVRRERRGPLEARPRGRLHTPLRDREAIRHHYDVADEFYGLFLGENMVYSCAFFPRGGESIEAAQRAKLDLVCRKLDLGPGDRLLDVGCGWGALVDHAAARYGARAVGITVSANQLAAARRKAAAAGGRVEIREADWRVLRPGEPYDRIASVGMMEHVGRRRLDAYLAKMHRLLRPGGLFLNHAIAEVGGGGPALRWAAQRGGGFIWRYVFPDGELLPISEVVSAAERTGFEVRDLECLREHYAETLAAWLARLEARFPEAVAIAGEPRARLYRLYLAASAASFRLGRTSVYQLLLAKPGPMRTGALPRCRADWYRPSRARAAAAQQGDAAGGGPENDASTAASAPEDPATAR